MEQEISPPRLSGEGSVLICRSNKWLTVNFKELWAFRELLYFMVWRDLKVRYKQTFLGVAWALIQPLSSMLVFAIFLGKLAKIPSDGIPYPIFAYCGILVWQIFSRAITEGSVSLATNEHILTKVYFPRLLIPISTIFTSLVDFGIAFTMLIGMMFYYRIFPGWQIVTLPAFLLLAAATGCGVAFWLSALSAKYRDVRYTLGFLNQFWFFLTPVIYPSSLVPEKWRWIYGVNPMTGVVEGFRFALLGKPVTSLPMLGVSVVVVIVLLAAGLLYFGKTEKTLADVI